MIGCDDRFANLIERYIVLEKEIQKLIDPFSRNFCGRCTGKCCREEICRESIDSAFLLMLIEKQSVSYDHHDGWQGSSGCRLAFARPLVCYDFFCDDICKSHLFKTADIQTIIHDFISIGNKAHGNTHLLCIDNLDVLSPQKIQKILYKVSLIINRVDNIRLQTDAANSA